jgi:hypothetical protein
MFKMIRPATPEDAKACVPLIDIVFEEMEIPSFDEAAKIPTLSGI